MKETPSMTEAQRETLARAQQAISPDDGKYYAAKIAALLSAEAEWMMCARIQRILLATRVALGQAGEEHLAQVDAALEKIDPAHIAFLEANVTKHDQLAVIEEIGRFVSPQTKALLHPGTTSYDILDTARSYLLKKTWFDVLRPAASQAIVTLCTLSEQCMGFLQVGRTHLQDTSPVPLGTTLAAYAARLADRMERTDVACSALRGKVSGIVGTGASVGMVVGQNLSLEFEKRVLDELDLEPDYTATQVVQKERLSDVGHALASFALVLGDFANDMRLLYSSSIGEITSREGAQRLGGSSADAMKNNPIDWENIAGKAVVIESGMRVLYAMIQSDLQRDLRGSVMARYQPQAMFAQLYESLMRCNKALAQFSVNEDALARNLEQLRKNPSEAMVAILRGEPSWVHPEHGVGHDFVKEMGKLAKKTGEPLLTVALQDSVFADLYLTLSEQKKAILEGNVEQYTGTAPQRALINREFALAVVKRQQS